MKEKTIAVQAKDLSIGYLQSKQRKVVQSNINLTLHSGEVTCLLGLNGAGKSTLIRTLCGFQPPLEGDVLLRGKPLSHEATLAAIEAVTMEKVMEVAREVLTQEPCIAIVGKGAEQVKLD